jgi:TRAP-type C4-dicarboxylate transport system permease small subunit
MSTAPRSSPPASPAPAPAAGARSASPARRALDLLYRGAGALAGAFLVTTFLVILAGILSRSLGFYLRGTDDYAGYAMAASGFLALGYTFKHGEHIRVSLVLERLSGGARRALEIAALAVSTLAAAAFAWYSARLAWNSHLFNDVSQGVDATPLWIPQLGMAAGAIVLLVALVDDLLARLLGGEPSRLARHAAEPANVE